MRGALSRGAPHVLLRLVGQALEFVGWAIVARRLGAHAFGTLAIPFTIARYGGLIADWGTSISGPRDVARSGGRVAASRIRHRQWIGLGLTAASVILLVASGRGALAPLGGVILARGINRDWVALGRHQMIRAGLPTLIQGACLATGALAAESTPRAASAIGAAYAVAGLVSMGCNRSTPRLGPAETPRTTRGSSSL